MNADSISYVLEQLGSGRTKTLGDNVMSECPLAPYNHASGRDTSMKLGVKVTAGISPANCFYPGCFHGTLMGLVDAVSAQKVKAGEWKLGGDEVSNLKGYILLAEEEDVVYVPEADRAVQPLPREVTPLIGNGSPYWESRGISKETAAEWKLGEGLGRAFIPLLSKNGDVLAIKGRLLPDVLVDGIPGMGDTPSQKYRAWPPGFDTSKHLSGQHLLSKPVDFLLVVESEADAVLFNDWFKDPAFKNALPFGQATEGAVAVATMGGKFSPAQVQLMVEALSRQGEVAVGMDADHAGRYATRQLVDALRLRLPTITEIEWELKDPSDSDGNRLTADQVKANALAALERRQDWFAKRVQNLTRGFDTGTLQVR